MSRPGVRARPRLCYPPRPPKGGFPASRRLLGVLPRPSGPRLADARRSLRVGFAHRFASPARPRRPGGGPAGSPPPPETILRTRKLQRRLRRLKSPRGEDVAGSLVRGSGNARLRPPCLRVRSGRPASALRGGGVPTGPRPRVLAHTFATSAAGSSLAGRKNHRRIFDATHILHVQPPTP